MSSGVRITVGVVVLSCAVFFTLMAVAVVIDSCQDNSIFQGSPSATEVVAVTVGLSVLGWALALVYLSPRSHPITLRILGAVLLLALLGYLVQGALAGERSTLVRFLLGLLCLGLPGLYMLVYGRIPLWYRR